MSELEQIRARDAGALYRLGGQFDSYAEQAEVDRHKLLSLVDALAGALRPFADRAHDEPCDCDACKARATLKSLESP